MASTTFGDPAALSCAWERNIPLEKKYPKGFAKDALIANEIENEWRLVLPGWSGNRVYIRL